MNFKKSRRECNVLTLSKIKIGFKRDITPYLPFR